MLKIYRMNKNMINSYISRLINIDKTIKYEKPWRLENFLLDLKNKWELTFIAFYHNEPVGFICCSQKDEEIYPIVHIHRIAVLNKYQKKGIGKKLLGRVERESIKYGINCITCLCNKNSKKALTFYKRMGFNSKSKTINGKEYIYLKKYLHEK